MKSTSRKSKKEPLNEVPTKKQWTKRIQLLIAMREQCGLPCDDHSIKLAIVKEFDDLPPWFDADSQIYDDSRQKKTARPKPRNRPPLAKKPLTTRQAEVIHIVGECSGSLSAAGRRLGLDRKTIKQHYDSGMKKLGRKIVKCATQSLPLDRRGQSSIAQDKRRPQVDDDDAKTSG